MSVPKLAMIADDLTGAADAGIAFSSVGLMAIVALSGYADTGLASSHLPAADVYVINTHSRHLSSAQAGKANRLAAQGILAQAQNGRPIVYQKIDSTLRGHPTVALHATAEALQARRILVALAFPAQKRITVAGQQIVDGQPLQETEFGKEVQNANLLDIFQSDTRRVQHLPLQLIRDKTAALKTTLETDEPTTFVADATTESDLKRLTQTALQNGISLFCGSAGLAHALATELQPTRGPTIHMEPIQDGPLLICAGSRHPQTRKQVEAACRHGTVLIEPTVSLMRMQNREEEIEFLELVAGQLTTGRDLLIATAGLANLRLTGQEIAHRLGTLASEILGTGNQIGGLILTGGDTAMAVCQSVGASHLLLQKEIEPGIASGRIADGIHRGLPIVTKAGGFGNTDALANAAVYLHSMNVV